VRFRTERRKWRRKRRNDTEYVKKWKNIEKV
jgi:hypothetical protein